MNDNETKTYTSLRLTHAKSLQDISELKKLREAVGKNIREASLLVDGHDWDYTEHCENLKKTRERFSKFERKLSNATLENGNTRCNRWDGSLYSYSSGDDNGSIGGRKRYSSRPSSVLIQPRLSSLSDQGSGWKSQQRFSYCSNSDAQSVSSAHSCSPNSQRSRKFKQIVVPIYEDSFDSGVSVQATSPRTSGPRSTITANGYHDKSNDHRFIKSYNGKGSIYDSDTSSAVSFADSRTTTESNSRHRTGSNQKRVLLSQNNWRSTPNLLEGDIPFPNTGRRRNKSLVDVHSFHSVSDSTKRDLASKASEWKSLPELGSRQRRSRDGPKRAKKKKGLVHLFRRITKSGEYVLQNDKKESKERERRNMKRTLSKEESISNPYSASPLGKTIEVIEEGKVVFHRVEIKLPRNGLYGFYVQKGFKKSKKGVFIGSFVTPQMKKLFAGVIKEGDEIIEINTFRTDSIGFEKVVDILHDTKLLNLLIIPYVRRKK